MAVPARALCGLDDTVHYFSSHFVLQTVFIFIQNLFYSSIIVGEYLLNITISEPPGLTRKKLSDQVLGK